MASQRKLASLYLAKKTTTPAGWRWRRWRRGWLRTWRLAFWRGSAAAPGGLAWRQLMAHSILPVIP